MDKRHILLNGERGVGKSTLIRRLLTESNLRVGGFCTKLDRIDGVEMYPIYIYPAAVPVEQRIRSAENLVGRCDSRRHEQHIEVFDTLGVRYLQDTKDCDVLVMDELGFMESKAQAFRTVVLQALDGDIPVLAAVKNRTDVEFLNQVRAHPAAQTYSIDVENREQLFETLLPIVKNWHRKC